jgi:hypothetical protein
MLLKYRDESTLFVIATVYFYISDASVVQNRITSEDENGQIAGSGALLRYRRNALRLPVGGGCPLPAFRQDK